MIFEPITPGDFATYAAKSPYKSFMQTPEIAEYRESNGWTPYFFAVKDAKGKILAATMLVAKPTFLGKSTFIAPGGPLLDLEDTKLTQFFFKHLGHYIKSHNGYVLHISPYYELTERDRDGQPLKNGFDHQKALKNLRSLGFQPLANPNQPQYHFAIDIDDRTPDQLLADFKRNTRGHIRKADKAGVTVRELKREELNILKQITESTAARRDFTDKPLSYYEQMYDLFHKKGEVKFTVAEAVMEGLPDNAFFKDNGRLASSETYIPDGAEKAARRADFPGRPAYDVEGEIVGPEKGMSGGTPVPLSAAMFMLYGSEVVYLFSGSDERYMKEYNAQYAIQWHMIKYAAEHKFKRYNFYGISGLPKNGDLDGIYEFKKGFASGPHGHVIELIGSFDLPINKPFCHLHSLLSKLKHH